MSKSNIILIGMPGCGKSTVGVVLAKNMGYRFLDSDICIQEQEKRLLHEIISEEGLDGFLAIENRVNASLQVEKHVIATGGSAIYGVEAMEHLSEIGIIIYLNLPYEEKVQMGLNGRKKVEDNFDRQIVVEKYIGELNSI